MPNQILNAFHINHIPGSFVTLRSLNAARLRKQPTARPGVMLL